MLKVSTSEGLNNLSIKSIVSCAALEFSGMAGNVEAYQAPTSTRPLELTRSVPDFSGYEA